MRSSVFIDRRWVGRSKGRFVIHVIDGDRKLLELRSVVTTVGRAAIVLNLHVERRRAVGIRSGRVRQIAAGVHAGRDSKETCIADIADCVGEHALAGFIGRTWIKRCPAVDRLRSSVFVDRRWVGRRE